MCITRIGIRHAPEPKQLSHAISSSGVLVPVPSARSNGQGQATAAITAHMPHATRSAGMRCGVSTYVHLRLADCIAQAEATPLCSFIVAPRVDASVGGKHQRLILAGGHRVLLDTI